MPKKKGADPISAAEKQLTDLAKEALLEITEAAQIGALAGIDERREGGSAPGELTWTVKFECLHPAYPGWHWTATLAAVNGDAPTVLEVALLPGTEALLAPKWVPWAERLALYREAQAREALAEIVDAEAAALELADEDFAEDDVLDNDFSDFDDEIDGVDVDEVELDDADADDADDSDSDEDDADDADATGADELN
ncbi:DUF3027 domain-containing protein [Leucobacter sp. OH1287]|uniref:DUF3027 domain-containing protein n=1 Tax=Leucobacter sp. OH1287 TaxID=2491049 RepID=UPI000F5D7008|nr:DUF3027 domain-containing protein [Leucobacter sp. OH1287]RRD61100.1 DUF3027 domain-containing protein [Leucobacter sp. OH1287]